MKEVKEFLLKNKDPKYKDFSLELNIYHNKKSLGVKIPKLRDLAKTLSKEYNLEYLINNIDEEYYEEIELKGFIIGCYKNLTYLELTKYIDNHLTKVSDWCMCDTFAASLKITKKYLDKLWSYLLDKLNSKKEFEVRFALVMILNYYISDIYKNDIYEIIKSIKREEYYIKMANAWLLSYMFISYFNDTINYIKRNKINGWTLNKGITKAIESHQITNDQKIILRKIRDNVKETH